MLSVGRISNTMNSTFTSEVGDNSDVSVDMEMRLEVKTEPDLDLYNSGESMSYSTEEDHSLQTTGINGDKDSEELEDEPLVVIYYRLNRLGKINN